MRIDLPRPMLADRVGCVVWLALAIGLELVAAPALGLPPGATCAAAGGIGAALTWAAMNCRHRPMALVVSGRRIEVLAAVGPAAEWIPDVSRVLGGTVVVGCPAAAHRPWRGGLWITPHDVPAVALRRLARTLRLHRGPLEA